MYYFDVLFYFWLCYTRISKRWFYSLDVTLCLPYFSGTVLVQLRSFVQYACQVTLLKGSGKMPVTNFSDTKRKTRANRHSEIVTVTPQKEEPECKKTNKTKREEPLRLSLAVLLYN